METLHHEKGSPTQVSKAITKMIRLHDQDEREQDGSYHWDTVKSVLLKVFAQEGAEQFSDKYRIQLIRQGSRDTPGMHTYSEQLEGVCLSQGIFMEFSIYFGE